MENAPLSPPEALTPPDPSSEDVSLSGLSRFIAQRREQRAATLRTKLDDLHSSIEFGSLLNDVIDARIDLGARIDIREPRTDKEAAARDKVDAALDARVQSRRAMRDVQRTLPGSKNPPRDKDELHAQSHRRAYMQTPAGQRLAVKHIDARLVEDASLRKARKAAGGGLRGKIRSVRADRIERKLRKLDPDAVGDETIATPNPDVLSIGPTNRTPVYKDGKDGSVPVTVHERGKLRTFKGKQPKVFINNLPDNDRNKRTYEIIQAHRKTQEAQKAARERQIQERLAQKGGKRSSRNRTEGPRDRGIPLSEDRGRPSPQDQGSKPKK